MLCSTSSMKQETDSRSHAHKVIVIVVIAAVALALFLGSAFFLVRAFISSGITRTPDNLFGDQNLKTAVALLELHKVRYGKYPGSMDELKFTGQSDQMAIQSVNYYTNGDRTAYYIEVERGWVGKPDLVMPDEFWQGTGYSVALKPTGR